MAELHPNQIPFQAGRTAKANFVAPEDYLSRPLAQLGELSEQTANTIAAYKDNQLIKQLEDIDLETQNAIKNEKSLDANYDYIANDAVSKWRSALNGVDEPTRERFLRNNPYAAEEFEIAVRAKVLEKQQKQIYNRSKLDIAQWSSQIVNAPKDQQAAMLESKRIAIQNLGLPIEQTDDLLFSLQSEVDNYQIAYAIANNDFEMAKDLLRNGLPTVGASGKASYWKQLQDAIEKESYRKAAEEKALLEAKENGKDVNSQYVLELHDSYLQNDNLEAARQVREAYYHGLDIPRFDKNGHLIEIIHSSDVAPTARQKLFGTMLTASNQAPSRNQYRTDYLTDFNRLKSGLMSPDGSLDLDSDEYITPEQYELALKLKKDDTGWDMLSDAERVFVDNVLRGYGTLGSVSYLDLNENAQLMAHSYGADYKKVNPVTNFKSLLSMYNNPTNQIVSALYDDSTLTGREVDTINYITGKYKKEKFRGDWELKRGTRSDALVTLFGIIATQNNPYGMKDVGLNNVTRENFEENLIRYLTQMKNGGFYEAPADYEDLISDYKNLYKMTTGFQYVEPESTSGSVTPRLQKYAVLTMQAEQKKDSYDEHSYSGKLPRDDSRNTAFGITSVTEDGSLYKINRQAQLDRSRQRAYNLEKDVVLESEGVKIPDDYFERREKERENRAKTFGKDVLGFSGIVLNDSEKNK